MDKPAETYKTCFESGVANDVGLQALAGGVEILGCLFIHTPIC